jgi:hypothetical protein
MNFQEWMAALNGAVCAQIECCYNEQEDGRWDENIITADILRALKSLHKEPVSMDDFYRSISWNAYKLKGTHEQIHGDIALIVKLNLESDKYVEGVAFIEAKRISHGASISSGTFSSIKWDRLASYSASSPAHYTIFYDYLVVGGKNTPTCQSLLTNHLLALGEKNRTIYRYSESISTLLAFRLLMGHGLDYRDSMISSAAGFSDSEVKYKYVVTADISVAPNLDASPIFINPEVYVDLDNPDIKPEQGVSDNDKDDSSFSPS